MKLRSTRSSRRRATARRPRPVLAAFHSLAAAIVLALAARLDVAAGQQGAGWVTSDVSPERLRNPALVGWGLDTLQAPVACVRDFLSLKGACVRLGAANWEEIARDLPRDLSRLDESGQVPRAKMAVDVAGRPQLAYIVWHVRGDLWTAALTWAEWTGAAWHVETVETKAVKGNLTPAVTDVMSGADGASIAYLDGEAILKVARREGGRWRVDTVDRDFCTPAAFATDADGGRHIVYRTANGIVRHGRWGDGRWSVGPVDVAGDLLAGAVLWAGIDYDGIMHVTLAGASDGGSIAHMWGAAAADAWQARPVPPACGWSTGRADFAVAGGLALAGVPRPAPDAEPADGVISVCRWAAASWTVEPAAVLGTPALSELRLATDGRTHLIYQSGGARMRIVHAVSAVGPEAPVPTVGTPSRAPMPEPSPSPTAESSAEPTAPPTTVPPAAPTGADTPQPAATAAVTPDLPSPTATTSPGAPTARPTGRPVFLPRLIRGH